MTKEKYYVAYNGNLREVPSSYRWKIPLVSGVLTFLIFILGFCAYEIFRNI